MREIIARVIFFILRAISLAFFSTLYSLRWYVLNREALKRKNFIIISNHQSYYDPVIISTAIGRLPYFLAKEELFKIPLLSNIIRALKALPIKRGQPDRRAIKMVLNLLSKGESLLIFPEGTRGSSNEVMIFQKGLEYIVSKSNVAVLPVYIKNAYKAWHRDRIFPTFFLSISIYIGDLIFYNEKVKDNFSSVVRNYIVELSKKL